MLRSVFKGFPVEVLLRLNAEDLLCYKSVLSCPDLDPSFSFVRSKLLIFRPFKELGLGKSNDKPDSDFF